MTNFGSRFCEKSVTTVLPQYHLFHHYCIYTILMGGNIVSSGSSTIACTLYLTHLSPEPLIRCAWYTDETQRAHIGVRLHWSQRCVHARQQTSPQIQRRVAEADNTAQRAIKSGHPASSLKSISRRSTGNDTGCDDGIPSCLVFTSLCRGAFLAHSRSKR